MLPVAITKNDFTLTEVGALKIFQPRKGFRFSVDALLLYAYAGCSFYPENILDIGTGSGIVSLLFAKKYPDASVFAFEIQKNYAELAEKNSKKNGIENLKIINDDVKRLPSYFEFEKFDLIVSNPPYRKEKSGKKSPYEDRNIAIYDTYLKSDKLFETVFYSLKKEGRFFLLNIIENEKDIFFIAEKYKFFLGKIIYFLGTGGKNSNIVLYEISKMSTNIEKIEVSEKEWQFTIDEIFGGRL